jgi:hypothetical protein
LTFNFLHNVYNLAIGAMMMKNVKIKLKKFESEFIYVKIENKKVTQGGEKKFGAVSRN